MEALRQELQAPMGLAWAQEPITSSSPSKLICYLLQDFMMFVRHGFQKVLAFVGLLCVFSCAQDSNCTTNVASTAFPSTGLGVQLQKFSYCGGVLNVTTLIEVSL